MSLLLKSAGAGTGQPRAVERGLVRRPGASRRSWGVAAASVGWGADGAARPRTDRSPGGARGPLLKPDYRRRLVDETAAGGTRGPRSRSPTDFDPGYGDRQRRPHRPLRRRTCQEARGGALGNGPQAAAY